VFFLCDIQERFAGGIQNWPAVIGVAQRMVGAPLAQINTDGHTHS
jgi:hypothetical protein